MKYSACLIYNPTSGAFPSGLMCEKAAFVLQSAGWEVELRQSQSGDHITELSADAARRELDAVFVAGGDGSINLAVGALEGTHTALGVLPAGTANVLAQEIGLTTIDYFRSEHIVSSARRLASGMVQSVDVGYCDQVPFLLWAGIGLDGYIIHHIEPRKPWEKQLSVLAYASKVVWNAHHWHGINLRVKTGQDQISGSFMMAIISNIRLYAGGLAEISPNAKLDDGQMDLWLFDGTTPFEVYQRALDLFSKRHLTSTNFHQFTHHEFHLISDVPMYTQLDAEPYQGRKDVSIRVVPRRLHLIVPRDVNTDLFTMPPVRIFEPD